MAGYIKLANCPECGSPIWQESTWWGVTPPLPVTMCMCRANEQMRYINLRAQVATMDEADGLHQTRFYLKVRHT